MLNECNWRHTCWNFWKRFGDWIHIFAPKPMTIVNFNFILCSMFIIKNWNASLVIVIGFGAKIWIQSPNLFQKFQQVWRQLHSLSIVDYPKLSMLTTLSRFFIWCQACECNSIFSIIDNHCGLSTVFASVSIPWPCLPHSPITQSIVQKEVLAHSTYIWGVCRRECPSRVFLCVCLGYSSCCVAWI